MATDELDQSLGLATLLKVRKVSSALRLTNITHLRTYALTYVLLKARYEAVWSKSAAGAGAGGGRLEYRTLPGTHVTPNLPALRGLNWGAAELVGGAAGGVAGRLVTGQAREVSDQLAFEQEALCAVVAAWALREAELCAGGWAG